MINSTEILLVRHAESTGNANHLLSGGNTNFGLSPTGKDQAALVAKRLSPFDFDKIYSSDLLRAFDTACAIAKMQSTNIAVSIKPDFRELNFGTLDGMPHALVSKLYPYKHHQWLYVTRYPEGFPNQENIIDGINRFYTSLTEILRDETLKKICIVSHGTIIRLFLSYIMGYSKDEIRKIPSSKNTAITKISFNKTEGFSVEYMADASHLTH